MAKAGEDGSFDSPGLREGRRRAQEAHRHEAVPEGLPGRAVGRRDRRGRADGNGKAAMDLMGQWAPTSSHANTKDKKGLGETSAGSRSRRSTAAPAQASEQFGGGDGFAIGKDAPPETVDFAEVPRHLGLANKAGASGGDPAGQEGPESSVTDPNMKPVLDARASASFVQLYLDQAYAPAVGQAVNDAVQTLFAGKASPQDVAEQDRGCRQGRIARSSRWSARRVASPASRRRIRRAQRARRPGRAGRASRCSCAGARALRAAGHRPDPPGDPLQRLQVERALGRSTTSSASRTSSAPSATTSSAARCGTTASSSRCRCCCSCRSRSAWR